MKLVKNDSLQSIDVYFRTPNGAKAYWLEPRESRLVPDTYISEHIKKLQNKKVLSVTNHS